MPRPDLALLPVSYRRIPLLAIGRDIYLDTRLILRVLESLPSSSPPLGATSPADMFTEQLLQRYMVEGPVFAMAAGLVPVEFVQDPTFKKDRRGMLGKTWEREELEEGRAESLNYVRGMCAMLEETILKDGRDWVLGARGPGMADIEGEWRDSCRWCSHCLSAWSRANRWVRGEVGGWRLIAHEAGRILRRIGIAGSPLCRCVELGCEGSGSRQAVCCLHRSTAV
jgi:hypothetical protein